MGIGVRKELKHMLFSRSAVSNSLPPHGLQHTRPPCPSPSPEACSNSHSLSRWCHPTSLSSVIPFSSCLQSFPASGPFLMSRLFPRWPKYWSLSFRISPSNEYSGLSRVFSNTTVQKHQFFGAQPTFVPTLTSVPDYQLGTVLCLCMGGGVMLTCFAWCQAVMHKELYQFRRPERSFVLLTTGSAAPSK